MNTRCATRRIRLATAAALVAAACTSGDSPTTPKETPTPAAVARVSASSVTGVVGAPLTDSVGVRVTSTSGAPVPNAAVAWAVAAGGGSVSVTSSQTNADGVAKVAWTLGTKVGENLLNATVASLPTVSFVAHARAGAPGSVAAREGDDQEAAIGSEVPVRPSVVVTDAFGNLVDGVTVTFTVESGGGTVSGNAPQTDATGTATVGAWRLGNQVGEQRLVAAVPGGHVVTFTAVALATEATSIAIAAGDAQRVAAGTAVGTPPSVLATDANGNPVPGGNVTFTVVTGGGSVTGATVVSGNDGRATVGSWTLGAAGGLNVLRATLPNGAAVEFLANAIPPRGSGYEVALHWKTIPSEAQHQVALAAVARWQKAVTGDLPDIPANVTSSDCGPEGFPFVIPSLNETIDDLLIVVDMSPIDGAGGVLGFAGPCFVRSQGSLSVIGVMRFDSDDLQLMENNGILSDAILHEMGHVIGVGTLWKLLGLLQGAANPPPSTTAHDPHFVGDSARAAFDGMGGSGYSGNKVPVENTGGTATADGHWRESALSNELMTGYISGAPNPLSRVTIASLRDIGYVVDLNVADNHTCCGSSSVWGTSSDIPGIRLPDVMTDGPLFTIDGSGRIRRLR